MIKLPEPAKCEGGWEDPCVYYYTESQLKQAVRDAYEEAANLCCNDHDCGAIRAIIKEIPE